MKKSILFIYAFLLISSCLFAQKNETVIVKAGTRVIDNFPIDVRYLYPEFTNGTAVFKNNKVYSTAFNYNFLSSEMEFINAKDTLVIADKADLLLVIVAKDTFYYHNGFLEKIRNDMFEVYVKEQFVLKDIRKKGAMGTVNRSAASESYDYWLTGYETKELVTDIDLAYQKEEIYYFSISGKDMVRFNWLNIINSVPGKKDVLKNYISAVKMDFNSREDILKLSEIVNKLLTENL